MLQDWLLLYVLNKLGLHVLMLRLQQVFNKISEDILALFQVSSVVFLLFGLRSQ